MSGVDRNGTHVRDRADGLVDAVLAISTGLDLDHTLSRLVEAAVELTGAHYGALLVREADGTSAQLVHAGIDDETRGSIGALPQGQGLLGLVFERDAPVRLTDLAADPATVGFPPGHPRMHSFLGVPIRLREGVFGALYLTDKNIGPGFTEEDESLVQALATAAGIAVDNASRYAESRLRQRWLEASSEVTTQLLAGAEPNDVLHVIADRALELGTADYTVIAVVEGDAVTEPAALRVMVHAGAGPGSLLGRWLPIVGSTTGAVFRDLVPRRLTSMVLEPVAGPMICLGPALVLPLRAGDGVLGVLVAARRPGADAFCADQVPVVAAFADHAALALHLARNQWRLREVDVLADRDRIARDLHDHVIQRLFAVGLALQGTNRKVVSAEVARRISDTADQLHDIVTEIRATIFDLHSGDDAQARPRQRLRNAIRELTADVAVRTVVRMTGPVDLVPAELAEHGEAVVREAVSNVVRHAGASTMTVTVSVRDDLVIEVVDDGSGLPDGVDLSGLRNLRDRADRFGGTLVVEPAVGGGTRLRWAAPLTAMTTD